MWEMSELKKRLIGECQKGNIKEVEKYLSEVEEWFLSNGVEIQITYDNMSVFFAACQWPDILDLLLSHPEINTGEINDLFVWSTQPRNDNQEHRGNVSYTDTALIKACRNGWTQSVERLLNIPNIDVNTLSVDGTSALEVAVRKGDTEVIEMLLKSPGMEEYTVRSAFLVACSTPRMFDYVENKPTATERIEIVRKISSTTSFSLKTHLMQ